MQDAINWRNKVWTLCHEDHVTLIEGKAVFRLSRVDLVERVAHVQGEA